MLNLIQEQKYALVDKLLDCPQFATNSSRQVLAKELSKRINNQISLGATYNAREETLAIVNACLAFEQGIAELTSVLSFFDGGSIAFEAVQVYVDALGFGGLLPFSSNMLPARNPKFVGRDKELASLHNTLQDTNMVAVTALHGLGGVGKTSLAIEYIYRHQKAYNLIVWLPAENRLTLELEFSGLLGVLGLPDMPIDTEENRARAVAVVKKELGRRGKGWLLIFDNAEQPEDVAAFRPGGAAGHVIVTSRNIQMAKLGRAVEVDVLTEGDALRLLAAYVYPSKPQTELSGGSHMQLWRSTEEAITAKQLVTELGYLALAIIQAGAYIQTTGCSVAEYLAEFKRTALELFGEEFARPTDYPYTVATTWELVFTKIRELNSDAADLMYLLAFFAPDWIKLSWFTDSSEETRACLPKSIAELTADNRKLQVGLAALLQYSLIINESSVLSVHRLVQRVTCDKLSKFPVQSDANTIARFLQKLKPKKRTQTEQAASFTDWFNYGVIFLLAIFPDASDYKELPRCDEMISHLQSVLSHYNRTYMENNCNRRIYSKFTSDIKLAEVGTLFARAARYYHERFSYAAAKPLYEQAIIITEKTSGREHPSLAARLNNLANLLIQTGDYTTARVLIERDIAITKKTLGSEHPDLAISLANLGGLLQTIGEYAEAKLFFERALAITGKTLGAEHPHFAIRLNNLANLFIDTGEYAEAKPLLEQALVITEKTLGAEHPGFITRLGSLALLLKTTGEYTEAKLLLERAINIAEKTLGNEHPDLATLFNNLANLFMDIGKYTEAKPHLERALAITEKIMGNEHPDFATSLDNLASLLSLTGEITEAKALFERAITITEKTLGSEHSNLATSLNNLALLLQTIGEYAEAEALFERAIAITEKTLGNGHPNFAVRLTNLACLLYVKGKHTEAKLLFERAISLTEKTLGNEHLSLAIRLSNLAILLHDTGETVEAVILLKRATIIFEKTLGVTHSRTRLAVQTHAKWESEL